MNRENGTCIWFNEKRGYGFVRSDSCKDAFVYYQDIKEKGFKSLYRGQRVSFIVEETVQGLKAVNVKYQKNFDNL